MLNGQLGNPLKMNGIAFEQVPIDDSNTCFDCERARAKIDPYFRGESMNLKKIRYVRPRTAKVKLAVL